MILLRNLNGKDPMDFNDDTAADRVGRRIKKTRMEKGLSRAELGELVGLSADRIQKYENGARKPKSDLLKKIARALDVETIALTDPVVSNYLGAMYALFEMEERYGIRIKEQDKRIVLYCENMKGGLADYLDEWMRECKYIDSKLAAATSDEEKEEINKEYIVWKRTFPRAIIERTEEHLRELERKDIEDQINKLQKQLSELDKK